MKNYSSFQLSLRALQSPAAVVLLIALLLWSTGMPWAWMPASARAAALTNLSDTLSDSDLSAVSDHTFEFTTTNALDADDTIDIWFDPTGGLFTINNLGASDFTATSGIKVVGNAVGACTGDASEVYVGTSTAERVSLTVCTGDTVAAGTKVFTMDNGKIVNPGAATSYVIRVRTLNEGVDDTSSIIDQGDTRVAIIDDVVVTASVDTTFTFTISGLPNGTTVNGTTTSTSSTATLLDFGTLTPGTPKTVGQRLNVATNARNGFSVTVYQDQNLTSATGADIDLYIDGATTSTPTAWTAPANTLDNYDTYGHIGLTSSDSTLSAGDVFGANLYVGDFVASTSQREIFYHDGPSDGTTDNIGSTTVAYTIQITNLQEAGTDYSNILTYIATPTF